MARTWTALYGSICTSKKLKACANDASRVFYLLLLTQVDPWGRTEDDAETLCARAWPLLGKSEKDTEKALADLHSVGLVTRHDVEGLRFLQVEGWENHAGKHQGGSKGSPKFPDPPRISPKLPGLSGEVRGVSSILSESPSPSEPGKESVEREPKPPTRRPATGPAAEITQAFSDAFLAARGVPYAFEGAKDGRAVQTLLARAGGDPRAVIARIPSLFADEFYGPKANLTMFVSGWNKLAPPKPRREINSIDDIFRLPKNGAAL